MPKIWHHITDLLVLNKLYQICMIRCLMNELCSLRMHLYNLKYCTHTWGSIFKWTPIMGKRCDWSWSSILDVWFVSFLRVWSIYCSFHLSHQLCSPMTCRSISSFLVAIQWSVAHFTTHHILPLTFLEVEYLKSVADDISEKLFCTIYQFA